MSFRNLIRTAYLVAALAWMTSFVVYAQRQRDTPTPLTIENFRFQELERKVNVLEDARFDFSSRLASMNVSLQEMTKTQDANRSLLIGVCGAMVALIGELLMRLFDGRKRPQARA